jgi:hypothetical protein
MQGHPLFLGNLGQMFGKWVIHVRVDMNGGKEATMVAKRLA